MTCYLEHPRQAMCLEGPFSLCKGGGLSRLVRLYNQNQETFIVNLPFISMTVLSYLPPHMSLPSPPQGVVQEVASPYRPKSLPQ